MMNELYPFQGKYLMIGNFQYHYLDEGEGHPVIMVHGNPSWSFLFRNVVKKLRHRYRCIVVDHIGCGLSSKPACYEYKLENHTANLVKLVKNLKLTSFDLIVHDWGGPIGMGLAEHFHQKVRHIIPMNTACFTSDLIPKRINLCRYPLFGKFFVQGLNGFARGALFFATAKKLDERVKRGFLFPYADFAQRRAIYEFIRDIPMKSNHRSWKKLKEIEAGLKLFKDEQICLIWGLQDWCFDTNFLYRWQQFFPRAKVFGFENAGHYLLEDEPEKIIKCIEEFLNKKLSF